MVATPAPTPSGGTCATCGNFYDKAFTVVAHDGSSSMFDSIECAVAWIAPVCAHCAEMAGDGRLTDRADADDQTTEGPDADG